MRIEGVRCDRCGATAVAVVSSDPGGDQEEHLSGWTTVPPFDPGLRTPRNDADWHFCPRCASTRGEPEAERRLRHAEECVETARNGERSALDLARRMEGERDEAREELRKAVEQLRKAVGPKAPPDADELYP